MEENRKVYDYTITQWDKYGLTNTQDDFIALQNILYVHGLTLETFYEGWQNGEDVFCGIIFDNTEDIRHIVNGIFEYNYYLPTYEDVKEYYMIEVDNYDGDVSCLNEIDLRKSISGWVSVLHY